MASDNELITRQQESFDNIKKICVNFKKDSLERKNLQYLELRINALRAHWEEFQHNHDELQNFETKDIPYFANGVYMKTKTMYEETIQAMLELKENFLNETEPTPEKSMGTLGRTAEPTFSQNLTEVDEKTSERRDVLLRQQQANFRSFGRAVAKINLKTIKEKWDLEDNLSILKTKWEVIDKTHWELDNILRGSNSLYDKEYEKWETTYDQLRRDINKRIYENIHYEKSTPKMDIPTFDGDYNKWVSFKDLFSETIHSNPLISKSQKMQHLKGKLKGEAEKLVQHLSVSAENYESCWELLNHRYNNIRMLFTTCVNTLLNQPLIQQANAQNIRKLHDTTLECLNALQNLNIEISTWDPLVVHILVQKLDSQTYNEYIQNLGDPRSLPDFDSFIKFLESKFMAFETLNDRQTIQKSAPQQNTSKINLGQRATNFKKYEKATKTYHTGIKTCPMCKTTEHVLMNCDKFLGMNFNTRKETVAKLQLCRNCLFSHGDKKCTSWKKCKECGNAHHTLLHDPNYQPTWGNKPSTSRVASHVNDKTQEVLLATAQLLVKDQHGTYITLRALLDQGSQVSLITENAAQRLKLPRNKFNAIVSGVGSAMGSCRGLLQLDCRSINNEYAFKLEALIMKSLISNLPNSSFDKSNWDHLDNVKLADPNFNTSGPIDILLGADIYSEVILDGVLRSGNHGPIAQQTKLGWILCGNIRTFNCMVMINELHDLTKFWETEEIAYKSEQTLDDERCENYYLETTKRLDDGRYVVKMPLKPDIEGNLGKSRPQAVSQFFQLEKKMLKNEEYATQYKHFIEEYTELGHMKPALPANTNDELEVYIPHHGVLREDSETTKLRVVFNASMKTTSKRSLNDLMDKGPNLQRDIQSLIIKWRTYRYVLTADIEKMFRQILLAEDQQCLQKIIWRASTQNKLEEKQLCTVTYGTKAAPFLAMRTLKQLAFDDGHLYPNAAKVLMSDFYMDDLISGENSIEAAKTLRQELSELLRRGGFNLRKWSSNEKAILDNLTMEQTCQKSIFNFKQEETTKTLGLSYNSTHDKFVFQWDLPESKEANYTKRMLLSEISKLYDPLGWLAPITIKAKLLFQKVWVSELKWDDVLPKEIEAEWVKLRKDLPNVKQLSLTRWLGCTKNAIEVHGFCDASEKAYACVIYSRQKNDTGDYITTMIASKTRVAPLKKKTTLPRLELCGAQLLTNLMEKVKTTLTEHQLQVFCWTDSTVVLAWLQGNASRWEPYIASRASKITKIVPASQWHHVRTEENPADCTTRGLSPTQLANFNLWWEGPQWLRKTDFVATSQETKQFTTDNGVRRKCLAVATQSTTEGAIINALLDKCSSMTRLTRILSWVLRFISGLRNKGRKLNYLTSMELKNATDMIIKHVQRNYFRDDIEDLENKGSVKTSSILNLNPFLDGNGILRVGGRLQNSALPMETKHPAILPHSSRLTELAINQAHKETLHGGVKLTLSQTRQKYWIVGGNSAVKKELRKCVICHKYNPHKNAQLMGDLPKARVTPSRPFTHTGIDFTGHVDVKTNKGRGVRTSKGYIAIFICMATKAVHLELVSDLTTQTFIAALKRMCARRGTPEHIYTDNGTNFRGASRLLYKEFQEFKALLSPEFFDEISQMPIQWHFNAPIWPTAGGLWEAAVKSMKFHLKRVLGQQLLTYESFTTLLTQIEACMNSRPLSPLSENVDDLDCITPGHFLVGGPVLSLPQSENENDRKINLRDRWALTELLHQHFWKKWSMEYLHLLQTRSKWLRPKKNLEEGQLVLIIDNNLPPGKWALGRVLQLHPGADGYVRVVTLRTRGTTLKRPITKVTPLPLPLEDNTKQQSAVTNQETSTQETKRKVEPQEETQQKKRTRTRTKRSFYSYLTLFMMTFMALTTSVIATTTSKNYNLTTIDSQHPIYYDEIGKIQQVHDEWLLLVYYNLTTYWKGSDNLQVYIGEINKQCNRMEKQLCEPMVLQLQHELRQLQDYNTLLLSQHLDRKKRGYFNGIGSIARTLFGVLDEDFAVKYQQDIENIQTNENYLLYLLKNQTMIVEAENNIIKKNEQFMNKQFQLIHDFVNETETEVSKIESRVETLITMNDLTAASVTASLILINLRRTQEMLLNSLTNIYQGHLDKHLFTPKELIQQLNVISGRIPRRLSLPVRDIQENIKEMYKLLYVKARITKQFMLFELHIPLTSGDGYTAYRVIPLPIQLPTETRILRTDAEIIAINFKKETYISYSEAHLQQCLLSNEESFICNADRPVYNLNNRNAPCEAKIFSQQSTLPCDTIRTKCTDSWIKLHKPNWWIYVCCTKCQLRIICEERVSTTTISGVGQIVVGQDCILQKQDATVFSYNYFANKMNIESDIQVPTFNIQINDLMNENLGRIQFHMENNDSRYDTENVERLLKIMKDHETLPKHLSSHDIHHYTIIWCLLGGALATAVYFMIRKGCFKKQGNPPQPGRQPERNEHIELQVIDAVEDKTPKRKTRKAFDFE